jgi:hypothetical protein
MTGNSLMRLVALATAVFTVASASAQERTTPITAA